MKKLLLLALLLFGFGVNAQKTNEDNAIYTAVEIAPAFPNGFKALYHYFCENTVVPKFIPNQDKVNSVIIRFVIEKDGSVTYPEIIRGINDECDKEALRVIKSMPKWEAGGMNKYSNWKPLRCYMTVLIKFFQNKSDCEKSYSQSLRGY
jgi:periplasmic protein TonB